MLFQIEPLFAETSPFSLSQSVSICTCRWAYYGALRLSAHALDVLDNSVDFNVKHLDKHYMIIGEISTVSDGMFAKLSNIIDWERAGQLSPLKDRLVD